MTVCIIGFLQSARRALRAAVALRLSHELCCEGF